GASAISCSGTIAAPCIAAIPSIRRRGGSCIARKSRARHGPRREPRRSRGEEMMVSVAESDWRRYVRPAVGNQVLWLPGRRDFPYYIDRVNIATAAPLIKADLGLSNTELGAAFGAFAAPYTIFQLIGGWLGDRLGPRRTLGIGGLIVCAATALTGLVGSLQSL